MKKYTRDIEGIKAFGSRLRDVRKRKGLSQEDLANAADLELSQIFQIARALNIHPKDLFED